jgi:hypothetical protein
MAASGLATTKVVLAAKPLPNLAKRLDMNIKPDFRIAGGTLLITPRVNYLTFKALWGKDLLDSVEAGTAVIELEGCLATRFRYPGGEPDADDACLADTLEMCNAYEVENSSWLKRVQDALPKSDRPSNRSILSKRHFVFTFFSTSFECLADGLNVDVSFKPFSDIIAACYTPR